jgi:hypothetical protein
VDQCVHLALARADLVVQAQVVQVAQVLVAQVADQVVLVVVVLAAVLAVAVTVNAVHQRRSHVLVVVKTSMKCCHRQPRRIRKVMLQFLKALSLSNVVLRRKSLHQS